MHAIGRRRSAGLRPPPLAAVILYDEARSVDACPSEEDLLAVLEHAEPPLESPQKKRIFAHVDQCAMCRELVASFVKDTRPNAGVHKAAETIETLAPGQVIGRYVLVRCLGVGGAGVVWEGRDGSESFALKVLRHSASENVRRHRREARIAMTLQHPNIVPVREVFDDPALGPVLVMPLLVGETFESILGRSGKLSLEHTAAYLLPVLYALAYAHGQGVVHRDLKPQNVFVQRDRISILDFGVAKLLEESSVAGSAITRTGELLGTPRYMAPEQIFGEQRIDARVDVWATGVIAYRTLSGEHPVAGRSLGEVIKLHTRGAIVPLEQRAPELPRDVTNAVMHALQGEYAKRAPSVDGLGAVLSTYARGR